MPKAISSYSPPTENTAFHPSKMPRLRSELFFCYVSTSSRNTKDLACPQTWTKTSSCLVFYFYFFTLIVSASHASLYLDLELWQVTNITLLLSDQSDHTGIFSRGALKRQCFAPEVMQQCTVWKKKKKSIWTLKFVNISDQAPKIKLKCA